MGQLSGANVENSTKAKAKIKERNEKNENISHTFYPVALLYIHHYFILLYCSATVICNTVYLGSIFQHMFCMADVFQNCTVDYSATVY